MAVGGSTQRLLNECTGVRDGTQMDAQGRVLENHDRHESHEKSETTGRHGKDGSVLIFTFRRDQEPVVPNTIFFVCSVSFVVPRFRVVRSFLRDP